MHQDVFKLAKQLIEIESLTGNEKNISDFIGNWLKTRGWKINIQPVDQDRFNIFARHPYTANPKLLFNSHMDTVPPYIEFQEDEDYIYGRGACDTKGIIAAQLCAAQKLMDSGYENIGLLYVVGEEVDHCGIKKANELSLNPSFFIVGEPTESKMASSQKGLIKIKLTSEGLSAHSGYPESGKSAINPLLESLVDLKCTQWPNHSDYGKTTLNIGTIKGGIASNVIPDYAEAELVFRTTNDHEPLCRQIQNVIGGRVKVDFLLKSNPIKLSTLEGFETIPVSYSTDIAYFKTQAQIYLWGPGSILDAHTENEKIEKKELARAVRTYVHIAQTLL